MLLGELGELYELGDDLLDIVAVGAVHQDGGHRIQDGLVRGLEAPGSGEEGEGRKKTSEQTSASKEDPSPEARGQGPTCLGHLKHGLQGRDVLDKVILHISVQRQVGHSLHCPPPGPGVYGHIAQPPGIREGETLGKGARAEVRVAKPFQSSG